MDYRIFYILSVAKKDETLNNILSNLDAMKNLIDLLQSGKIDLDKFVKVPSYEYIIFKIFICLRHEKIPQNILTQFELFLEKQHFPDGILQIIPMCESERLLRREDAGEIFKLILNSIDKEQTRYAIKLAINPNVLDKENALDYINLIIKIVESCNLLDMYKPKFAYQLLSCKEFLARNDLLELFKNIINSMHVDKLVSEIMQDKKILLEENALEILKRKVVISIIYDQEDLENSFISHSQKEKQETTNFILKLDSEQLDNIWNLNNSELQITKVFILINDGQIPDAIKEILNNMIDNKDSKVYYTLRLLNSSKLLTRGDAKDFFEVIKNAKGEEQAQYASLVASNNINLASDNALEATKIIADSNEWYNAAYAYWIPCNESLASRNDVLEFEKAIANAGQERAAKEAHYLTMNKDLLKNELALQIILAVSNAKGEYQAMYCAMMAKNLKYYHGDDALKCLNYFSNMDNEEAWFRYVQLSSDLSKNNVKSSPSFLDEYMQTRKRKKDE